MKMFVFIIDFPVHKNRKIKPFQKQFSIIDINLANAKRNLAKQIGMGKCPNYTKLKTQKHVIRKTFRITQIVY